MNHSRPNILLAICDDLGYGDLSCHGNPLARTPRLDSLHHDGTRLTRYCSGPLCTAARARLMTGRCDYRTKAIDTYLGRAAIDPRERTVAEILRDAGYQTGLFGKWHLGDTGPSRPHHKGFEEALYHTGGGLQQPANLGRSSYFDPDLMHNGVLTPTQGYCTDVYTDAALAWLEQRHAERPWFCYWATNAPHDPLEIGDEWAQPYRDAGAPEPWARLYGMAANIDHNVGRLLDGLDRLGQAANTIVIFTSDHGPCAGTNVNGVQRYNAGLRGVKCQLYEGGIRVPCFVRWPGRVAAGRDLDRLANPIDWLPTLAQAAGAAVPTDRAIDGVSLLPLLTGQTDPADWPERWLTMQWHRGDQPQSRRHCAVVGQRHKWLCLDGQREELYDLASDPAEQHDLAAAQPALAAELRAVYDAWFADVSTSWAATPDEHYQPVPIPLGSSDENPVGLTRQDWRIDNRRESWDCDNPGWWPVRVEHPGPYRLTIDLPPGAEGTLTARCGGWQVQRLVPRGIATLAFEAVELPLGEQRFEIMIDTADGVLGPRCARLARLPLA
jgi:arylsulfatase A-like enzyme